MSPMRRRATFASVLMLAGAGLGFAAKPTKNLSDQIGMPNLETLFPKEFADWRLEPTGAVVLPSPYLQSILDKIYNQTLARTYVNSKGARVMLSVAYGGDQSDGTSAHRPEVCYPAQGFAITSNRQSTLDVGVDRIPIRQLTSVMGARQEPITYWVIVGDEVVTTGIGQKLAQMRFGLRGVIADGMLVRVSSIGNSPEIEFTSHRSFLADLAKSMPSTAKKRVFGLEGA